MSDSRRTFVKTIGVSSTILLAGCSSDDSEVQDSDGDDGSDGVSESTENSQDIEDSQTDSVAPPAPRVIATKSPEPQAVSTDSTLLSGNTYDFSVTIENTGEAGDVIITLQWLNDEGEVFENVTSAERYYKAGERREVTLTADLPDNVSKFEFSLSAASIITTVENSGSAGEVDVELYNSLADTSAVLATSTVQMSAGETRDVEIEIENGTLISEDTQVRAVSAE